MINFAIYNFCIIYVQVVRPSVFSKEIGYARLAPSMHVTLLQLYVANTILTHNALHFVTLSYRPTHTTMTT